MSPPPSHRHVHDQFAGRGAQHVEPLDDASSGEAPAPLWLREIPLVPGGRASPPPGKPGTSTSAAACLRTPLRTPPQVALNGRYDRYFSNFRKRGVSGKRWKLLPSTVEDSNFDVMPRELAMMLRQTYDSDISRPINYEKDREIRIFTSANAMPMLNTDDTKTNFDEMDMTRRRQWRAHLRDQLVFVGVPLTQVLHGNQNQPDMVSIQVAGSTTIFNTGCYDINAFDLVCWDVPLATTVDTNGTKPVTPNGLPASKLVFHTVPLRLGARDDSDAPKGRSIAHCTTEDVFRSMFNDKSGNGSHGEFRKRKRFEQPPVWDKLFTDLFSAATDDEKKTRLKAVLMYWTNTHLRYMHRVIGVALSKARPGEPFDIILQKAF